MARYGIATLLGDYPDTFEFTVADTPLHLTHIDVLEIELEPAEFIRKMRVMCTVNHALPLYH